MKLHIDHTPVASKHKISHKDTIVMIGSCFSENIGELLLQHKFNILQNPNGILFNPKSIRECIIDAIENRDINDQFLLNRNGLFFSFSHHSSIYHSDKEQLKFTINENRKRFREFLKTSDYLIITFGTAHIYEHQQTGMTVANCHKQNKDAFIKRLLTVEEIVSDYQLLLVSLKEFNPELKITFTVSPVKYLKEGLVENNLSKSTLLLAVNELCKNAACNYFPAYELVTDDLRDYRFYKEDMAHPNELAINYVWDKFEACYFSDETIHLNKEIHSIHLAEKHTLLFPESEEAKKFIENIEKRKMELRKKLPFLKI